MAPVSGGTRLRRHPSPAVTDEGVREEYLRRIPLGRHPSPAVTDEGVREEYLRRIPLGRLGRPDDVGRFVATLLSDESGWVTGQCIGVDGGHTIRQGPDLVPFFQRFAAPEGQEVER